MRFLRVNKSLREVISQNALYNKETGFVFNINCANQCFISSQSNSCFFTMDLMVPPFNCDLKETLI